MLASMSWLTRLGFVADRDRLNPRSADAAALLARCMKGGTDGSQALDLLYRRESGAVYRYALALCGDEALALDAMQEAFVQLLQQPQGFDPLRGDLGAYLAGIARHRLLRRLREARRFVELMEGDDDEADSTPSTATEPLLVQAQREERLWACIRRLAWSQREALVLVDLQERSYREAAAVAGVSEDVLRTRLHRARQRLAALLGEESSP
jgi:RNA polymerase sigma-70 factor (ECF subfamily)